MPNRDAVPRLVTEIVAGKTRQLHSFPVDPTHPNYLIGERYDIISRRIIETGKWEPELLAIARD